MNVLARNLQTSRIVDFVYVKMSSFYTIWHIWTLSFSGPHVPDLFTDFSVQLLFGLRGGGVICVGKESKEAAIINIFTSVICISSVTNPKRIWVCSCPKLYSLAWFILTNWSIQPFWLILMILISVFQLPCTTVIHEIWGFCGGTVAGVPPSVLVSS